MYEDWLDGFDLWIEEGRNAFLNGDSIESNPYDEKTEHEAHSTWERSYISAAEEEDERFLESDYTYRAKVIGGGWLAGEELVNRKKDADTFESETEPRQRLNQMKKNGKLSKKARIETLKESNRDDLYNFIDQRADMFPGIASYTRIDGKTVQCTVEDGDTFNEFVSYVQHVLGDVDYNVVEEDEGFTTFILSSK